MPIVLSKPFSAITSLEHDMREMVDRMLAIDRPAGRRFFGWKPAVDMVRQDGELVITAEVPGIKVEDLDIEVEENVLHIRGELSYEEKIDEENRYLSERYFGSFSRDLLMPEGIDSEKLEATFKDGVVTITVPVPEEVLPKTRKVEVKALDG